MAIGLWVFTNWSLACLDIGPLGPDGSVLLSIVAQARLLLYFYLCASEDLTPPSGDANEGYQWKIQTDESWVPN
jgi:hypothetical protein